MYNALFGMCTENLSDADMSWWFWWLILKHTPVTRSVLLRAKARLRHTALQCKNL